ncbi:MAG: DUF3990 domain-containing protein [Anaerolineaceae bacterium]|nr:DUF3990 domain-containing protein [Anaerolineaceae bacterium]
MVRKLTDGIILFHGSYCEVRNADLTQCKKYKDFGQGFYLTTNKEQAKNFALLSTGKAIADGLASQAQKYGIISSFRLHLSTELQIKIFSEANEQWLHCVVGHRRKKQFQRFINDLAEFDIIGGKIANDDTNATILTYMAGTFGEPGSRRADDICISLLLPERLKDQYCFRTVKSLECLEWIKSERVWKI